MPCCFLSLSSVFCSTVVRLWFVNPAQLSRGELAIMASHCCHIWQLHPPCKEAAWLPWVLHRLPKPNFSSLKVPLPCVVIISSLCLLKQRALDWTRVKSVIITWPADTAETVWRLTPANCLSAHIAQFFIFNGETWGGDFVGAFSLVSAAWGGVKPLNENPLFSSIILKQAVHSAALASL